MQVIAIGLVGGGDRLDLCLVYGVAEVEEYVEPKPI
jgi:hypothetical protein